MHDQSASRISGRTRAAVSAICVRALRITGLKSAGNFTRDECHDLSAEKIQRVKCFMFTRGGICCCQQFTNVGAAGWVRKFPVVVNWRKWRFASLRPVYPGHQSEGPACTLGAMSVRSGGMTDILDDSTDAVSSIPPPIEH
jgi:hypothetical protein